MDHDHDHDDYAGPVEVRHLGTVHTRAGQPRTITVEAVLCDNTTGPVRVLGRNPNRCRALLFADGVDYFLGPDQSVTKNNGFRLTNTGLYPPLEVRATDELWAIANTGAVAGSVVRVYAEHYDG